MSLLNVSIVLLSLFAVFLNIDAHTKYMDNGEVYAAIHTHSGYIWIGRNASANPRRDPRNIELAIEEFSEKDENGNMVQVKGHTISNLKSERYTFINFTSTPRPYSGVEAVGYDYTHNLTSVGGNVAATAYLFIEDGDIPVGGDYAHAHPGDLLLTLRVNNWSWAPTGKYLDVVYSITGPYRRMPAIKPDELRTRARRELDIGEGGELITPLKVNVDGTMVDFSRNHPAFEAGGRMRMRIPRFTDYAEYQLLVLPMAASESDLIYVEYSPTMHHLCEFDGLYKKMRKAHDTMK